MTLHQRVLVQDLRETVRHPSSVRDATAWSARASLIQHAAAHCPPYRALAPLLAAVAAGDQDAWSRIPVLDRSVPWEVAESWLSGYLPPGDKRISGLRAWSSVSTPLAGQLTEFLIAADAAEWECLLLERSFESGGILAAILPRYALRPGDISYWIDPWRLEAPARGGRRFPDDYPPSVLLDLIGDLQPQVLFCDAQVLASLVTAAESGRLGLREILTWTPIGDAGLVERCRERFAGRLHEVLTSPLAGFVAARGSDGTFTPASATQYVEIVDDAGRSCRPGEVGRLVATPLHARLRPLLRLDLGFSASWTSHPDSFRLC